MSGHQPLLVIVDDEQGILDVVSRFAERLGFNVAVCASGREAISLLQTRRPDVMLVDLRMPDVGGPAVMSSRGLIHPRASSGRSGARSTICRS